MDNIPDATQIQNLFDRIAPVYDRLNDSLSLGLHRIWKQMAISWSKAGAGQTCLDLCCGSGDLALRLAETVGRSGRVVGADFSRSQLDIARQRSRDRGLSVEWVQADALNLPFADATFDAATMGYGLRNLTDIPRGLRELYRVLKPGATAAILDMHRPTSTAMLGFQQWYLETFVVPTAESFGLTDEYAYIQPSLDRFPTGSQQVELARQAGFDRAVHYPIAGGTMGVLVAVKSTKTEASLSHRPSNSTVK
ncbi:bifunctional demethylmenaquinone methyltransferase/2-methoxy-6-polyprenyl-1,4-benzoquinol methylase UbiE [Baaleninema simplex]|uniref:bifunctional demethylmenaquinone methyltransferase/2-methoxy-6-polyprenyl-1,4-benzoquinol methylase UbiE n=1 Tax=Baaleninema simplex TaxID=2862350 RepID=UPI00034B7CA5|nr:bifunctional demethylmenaquinone methyltransferase/2-methoxy-6-polyprenyl-1,4-benzoquinol methylase UbiE [Baaleninema simplex]